MKAAKKEIKILIKEDGDHHRVEDRLLLKDTVLQSQDLNPSKSQSPMSQLLSPPVLQP